MTLHFLYDGLLAAGVVAIIAGLALLRRLGWP